RVEGSHLASEPAEQAAGFLGQEARIGPLADRAVENENARPVCGVAGPHQRHDVDRMELGKFDARKVQGDGLRHAGAPGAATVSPSSLVKVLSLLSNPVATFTKED